jgi:hypothetical protein
MMYHVGKVAKVAGKRGVPSDALSYNVCIYLYYIYLYIYIYIVPILVQASVDNVPWRLSLDAQYVLAVVMRC